MARGDEKKFVLDLVDFLREELAEELERDSLEVVAHQKVLSDLTCGTYPGEGGREPLAWPTLAFMEQDIAIGTWAKPAQGMAQFFTNSGDTEWIFMPRIIVEVKYQGVNSHSLITYSEIAYRMKGLYSNLRYYFLIRCGSKQPWTLERQGRSFDRIFQLVRAKGNRSQAWPGPYSRGDLDKHRSDADVEVGLRRMVADLRADLNAPRVVTTDPR